MGCRDPQGIATDAALKRYSLWSTLKTVIKLFQDAALKGWLGMSTITESSAQSTAPPSLCNSSSAEGALWSPLLESIGIPRVPILRFLEFARIPSVLLFFGFPIGIWRDPYASVFGIAAARIPIGTASLFGMPRHAYVCFPGIPSDL